MAEPVINADQFIYITGLVIDGLEGGYYHPRMRANMKPSDQKIMGDSGETMFGLDRKHGAQLAKYPEWAQFWHIIDNAQPPYWKHYYRGGILEPKLKALTARIMYQWFLELSAKYLTPASMKAIANDERLMIHFSYAAWNGQGWFQKFAKVVNQAVKEGKNKDQVWNAAISSRTGHTNKVIRQQGENMLKVVGKL
jgi:hypothetical protein